MQGRLSLNECLRIGPGTSTDTHSSFHSERNGEGSGRRRRGGGVRAKEFHAWKAKHKIYLKIAKTVHNILLVLCTFKNGGEGGGQRSLGACNSILLSAQSERPHLFYTKYARIE